ncbi:MAG: alpha/beta hydrolase, partial [Mycobacterium sp.]
MAPETFTTRGVGGTRIVADRIGDPRTPAVV